MTVEPLPDPHCLALIGKACRYRCYCTGPRIKLSMFMGTWAAYVGCCFASVVTARVHALQTCAASKPTVVVSIAGLRAHRDYQVRALVVLAHSLPNEVGGLTTAMGLEAEETFQHLSSRNGISWLPVKALCVAVTLTCWLPHSLFVTATLVPYPGPMNVTCSGHE